MSIAAPTALLREEERNQIVVAMHDNPDRVSELAPQTAGGKTYPAVQYRGNYGTFIVMFDPDTKLPAIVRTREFDVLMGDADYDATLSDWRTVGTFKLPFHIVNTLNGVKIFDTTIQSYTQNAPYPADAFNMPIAARRTAAKACTGGQDELSVDHQAPRQRLLSRLRSDVYGRWRATSSSLTLGRTCR